MQVSHDPTQFWVLVATVAALAGMVLSLGIKRRRVWVRMFPLEDGRTRVEFGGLARTDKAGWGEEFQYIVDDILERDSDDEDAADNNAATDESADDKDKS